jgi:hypothetical protein
VYWQKGNAHPEFEKERARGEKKRVEIFPSPPAFISESGLAVACRSRPIAQGPLRHTSGSQG